MAVVRGTAYDEVFEFLTSTPSPEQIVAFRPSEATQERLRYLLDQNRNDRLTTDERTELDEFMKIEHFMRMLKAKAYLKLAKA
ncbi:MAG: hypothetical protein IT324_33025 [Anaerolineae bacterium]|nr:hypothetical protein [Anaerolineae bacterium]